MLIYLHSILKEKIAKALEAADPVKEKYSHPAQLEAKVFDVFVKMVEILKGNKDD